MSEQNTQQPASVGAIGWLKAKLTAAVRRVARAALSNLIAVIGGAAVATFLVTYSLGAFFSFGPTPGAPETAFQTELDRRVPKILEHFHVPGVVIATVVDGAPSRTYAFGSADVAHHRPMRSDTVFRVASISKSLTAWGVVHLADTGKIDLEAPAENYLPAWPLPKSNYPTSAVTISRLLSHTAGLNAGEDTFRRPDAPAVSASELLKTPLADASPTPMPARLDGPAGQSFVYSVPGYALLQMVVEAQTGQDFDGYMKAAILRPLGMTSSSYQWDASLRPRTATPYLGDGQPSPVLIPQDEAADSLFTTAPDLARFVAAPLPDRALPAGAGVLKPADVARLYQPPSWMPRIELAAVGADLPGLGHFVEHFADGRVVVTNGGYDPGWSSQFFVVPSTRDGLVVLTNSEVGGPAIAQIAAMWSKWRGLPPTVLTRAYENLGAVAALAIGVLAAINISFGKGLALGIAGRRRRFAHFSPTEMAAGCIECLLAICIMWLWMLEHARVQALPTFDLVGTAAIRVFVAVTILRLLFPVADARAGEHKGPVLAPSGMETGYAG